MKCETIQRRMLLTPMGSRSIETHLAHCAACRQWREDYAAIEGLAREALKNGEPSETALIKIRREARVRAAEKRPFILWAPWLRPAYGLAAAALCVVAGGLWLRPEPTALGGEAELRTLLFMFQDEATEMPGDTSTTALDTMAHALLTLQGLDSDYTEVETTTPGEVPQATAPLTRNTLVPRDERYG